jgi:hypothetical protein
VHDESTTGRDADSQIHAPAGVAAVGTCIGPTLKRQRTATVSAAGAESDAIAAAASLARMRTTLENASPAMRKKSKVVSAPPSSLITHSSGAASASAAELDAEAETWSPQMARTGTCFNAAAAAASVVGAPALPAPLPAPTQT